MTRPDDATIRALYAALARGEIDAVTAYAHPDIEWVNSRHAIEGGVRRGIDEYERILRELQTTMRFDAQVDEILHLEHETVVLLTAHGQGVTSGAAAAQEMIHAVTWRDGKMARFRWFLDRDEAREAGLSLPPRGL